MRTIVFNHSGEIVSEAYQEFRQIYPKPGWVEHDAQEIWATQLATARKALSQAGIAPPRLRVSALQTSVKRQSIWDKATGDPGDERDRLAGPPDVGVLRQPEGAGLDEHVRENTGLADRRLFFRNETALDP